MVRYSRCPVMYAIYILAAILSSLIASVSASFAVKNISFQPPFLSNLKEGSGRDVRIMIAVESSSLDPPNFGLKYESEDPMVAWALGENEEYSLLETPQNLTGNSKNHSSSVKTFYFNSSFSVTGKFLGKTKIIVRVLTNETEPKDAEEKPPAEETPHFYNVWVIGDNRKMQHIFIGILSLLLIAANVLMGAQLNLSVVFEVLKKPLAPAIGFCCQYLFMPLVRKLQF